MKHSSIFIILLSASSLLGTSGCMTTSTLRCVRGVTAAQSKVYYDSGDFVKARQPNPIFYALVPFAVVGDVVTSPAQGFRWYLLATAQGL
jgi:hypothetical protein